MNKIWPYREFIFASVKREFQTKYRNSLFGVLWNVFNPLSQIFIYAVIFTRIMQAKLPGFDSPLTYTIYLCSGILTWFFFAELLNRSLTVFLDYASIIKKLRFPRICLSAIVSLSALLNFTIIFSLFTIFLCINHAFPGWPYLSVFLLLFIQLMLAVGLGTCLGIFNVFYRDVGQLFIIILQLWFWFTPIVYSDQILPPMIRTLMHFNPMYPIINAYHDIFILQIWPNWSSLMFPLLCALFFCAVTFRLFRAHGDEMVDEL